MIMPGRTGGSESNYRFGYQGQFAEKDYETGYNQFEARLYDARILRWMVPDPAGQYWSPYLSMGNTWPNGVDPDGMYDTKFGAWVANLFHGGNGVGYNSKTGEYFYSKGFSTSDGFGVMPVYEGGLNRYMGAFTANLGKDFHNNVINNWNYMLDYPLDAANNLSYNILNSASSLMYTQTYVDMYNGVKNYIQAPAEVKGMVDAQALSGTIENAATLAPLAAIAPELNGVGVNVRLYPNAKGVGMNVTKNGQRVLGLDWHQFKVGGKKTGTMVNRPHIDAPFSGMHHWPW